MMGVGLVWIRRLIGVALLAVTVVGGGHTVAARAAALDDVPPDPAAEPTVVLDEYSFGPADVAAAVGTVRLRLDNVGTRRHNMVVLVDGVEAASPYLRPGETTVWELTIERPGSYRFWCAEYRHIEKGMGGTLTIE